MSSATGLATETDTAQAVTASQSAPGAPTLSAAASDASGRISATVTEAAGAPPTSWKVFKASAPGGPFTDVSGASDIATTGVGTGSGTLTDLRPRYGAVPVLLGSPVYLKVQAVNGHGTSPDSNVVSATSSLNQTQVELDNWAAIRANINGNVGNAASLLRWAYPGYWWLVSAYVALTYQTHTSEALTDLQSWWTTSKTSLNADGLYRWETVDTIGSPGGSPSGGADIMGWQYNVEFGRYAMVCAKLLKNWLPDNTTAQSVAADMIAKANALGKAMIDKLSRHSVGPFAGYGANWPTVATATAWSGGATLVEDSVRRPTVANGRMYRLIYAVRDGFGNITGTGSTQPTWPTTDRGYVTDAVGNVWQDCTHDFPAWTAGMTVPLGLIVRPSTPNNHSYRATAVTGVTGGSQPTWPTTTGATVVDGGVTWKETTGASSAMFNAYYNASTYAVTDSATMPNDYLFETAAFFSSLIADPNATNFVSGTYRTTAQQLVDDGLAIGGSAQVGIGAVIQNIASYNGGGNKYDTNYGGFMGHSAALVARNETSGVALGIVKRMADWFDSDFASEATRISNGGDADGVTSAKFIYDIGWRLAVYSLAGRVSPLEYLLWDSSCHPTDNSYTVSGKTTTANDDSSVHPLVQIAIRASVALHVAIGQPHETDTAQAITHGKGGTLGIAHETDVAFALADHHTGQATETDSALTITPVLQGGGPTGDRLTVAVADGTVTTLVLTDSALTNLTLIDSAV